MKKVFLFTLVLGVLFVACKPEKKNDKPEVKQEVNKSEKSAVKISDGVYSVNAAASTLNWKGFKPTGSHNGTVKVKDGSLTISEGKIKDGKFNIDMSSITVLDIPADDEYNKKLVDHLLAADFFDVKNNTTSVFEITEIDGEMVKGNLTIKGISKPIQFSAKLENKENGVALISETFKIDRTAYNIQYKSKKFFENLKDKFIDDEFEISINILVSKN
ncbi:YceI family protein [Lutibacter citreus]|uniref:YceI family protein n=1 Tax=Lutibacter citreus TaxID=2138210 RepID=UPI000DBE60AE|nr:YceI family protein [Lutibacter citreus]